MNSLTYLLMSLLSQLFDRAGQPWPTVAIAPRQGIVLRWHAIAPFVSATVGNPRATLAAGTAVAALALMIGAANGTLDHALTMGSTVGSRCLATIIARGRRERERVIDWERERLRDYFDLSPVPMALLRSGTPGLPMLRASATLLELLPSQKRVVRRNGVLSPEDMGRLEAVIHATETSDSDRATVWLVDDGGTSWVSVPAARTSTPSGAVLPPLNQTLHDPLTGLANRDLLVERVDLALTRCRPGLLVGVFFVDLGRFTAVNDRYGNDVGDQVLQQVAHRLQDLLRQGDTTARVGGDKFVVVCDALADPDEALEIASRIRHSFDVPIQVGALTLHLTANIGVVTSHSDTTDGAELIRDADFATYQAKQSSQSRIEVFDTRLHQEATRRMDTEQRLCQALTRSELRLRYQPVVDIATGELEGVEALLRWQHPDLGLLSPAEFLDVAEMSGLIVPIGAWVLEEACRQLAEWDRNGQHLTMAVNISPRQLGHSDFAGVVHGALERSGADPSHLIIEITEQSFLPTTNAVSEDLQMLHRLGIRLSVDDFGTGYSSMQSLKRFPVSHLKVDKGFIDGLGHSAEDSAIVAATLRLAQELGLTSIAEGIETKEQLNLLSQYGCQLAQGYLMGKPSTAAELELLMA